MIRLCALHSHARDLFLYTVFNILPLLAGGGHGMLCC
jgi:hypothetical protein